MQIAKRESIVLRSRLEAGGREAWNVQKTATTDVLSMRMVKKTAEIEKLAKQLKNKAKGG